MACEVCEESFGLSEAGLQAIMCACLLSACLLAQPYSSCSGHLAGPGLQRPHTFYMHPDLWHPCSRNKSCMLRVSSVEWVQLLWTGLVWTSWALAYLPCQGSQLGQSEASTLRLPVLGGRSFGSIHQQGALGLYRHVCAATRHSLSPRMLYTMYQYNSNGVRNTG